MKSTPPSALDGSSCLVRQLRSVEDFGLSRISEMPGAPGKMPGNFFRSVFSDSASPFGNSRMFRLSRVRLTRMGVYMKVPCHDEE